MKITTPDLSKEKRVLTAMLTDTHFLTQTRRIIDPKLFESDYARIVARWCLEFFDRSGQAPGREMVSLYDLHKSEVTAENDCQLVATFLANLSREFVAGEKLNTDYSIQVATDYLRERGLVNLKNLIETAVARGDLAAGERFIADYQRPELPKISGIRLLRDAGALAEAFASKETDKLFRLPGVLGDLIGDIGRADFLALGAPFKTGKSLWADYIGNVAMMAGCKVVYYGLEMTDKQCARRGYKSIAAAPIKLNPNRKTIIPEFKNGTIMHTEYRGGAIDADHGTIEKMQAGLRTYTCGDVLYRSFPADTFSPKDLEKDLVNLEYYENYQPDVVIVDGADNMRADTNNREMRHKLDDIWKSLARIRNERNIAMVSVTHLNKNTKKTGKGEDTDLSEAGSKANHVTHLCILNQTAVERKYGLMRVTMKTARDEAGDPDEVYVLECRDIGRVCMDSAWARDIEIPNWEQGI